MEGGGISETKKVERGMRQRLGWGRKTKEGKQRGNTTKKKLDKVV